MFRILVGLLGRCLLNLPGANGHCREMVCQYNCTLAAAIDEIQMVKHGIIQELHLSNSFRCVNYYVTNYGN